MLRIASSPTSDMHVDSLRIALFNYIISQQRKEDLIIRIEDTDQEKNIEGKDKEILDILGLFGVEYSQVIYQSESVRFHTAMALQLMHEKKAFSCFCSSDWIENKKKEAKANKEIYKYDDACANLPAELVIDNTSPFCIRIKKPLKDIDSFVIMDQDKAPTYDFASAVDDMLNDISIIVCSENYKDNSSKQEHIRNSLKYDKKVEYIHLPIILNDTVSVKQLLEEGFLPEAILNYLISIGNTTPQEIFTLKEAIEWLDLSNISKSPARFDMDKLKEINNKHLMLLDDKELSRYVGFADEEIGKLAKVYLNEVNTTKELKSKIAPIFASKIIPEEWSKQSAILIDIIKNAPYFEKYDDFESYIVDKSGLESKEFIQTLCLLLTGSSAKADIAEIYKYIKNYIGEIVK